MRLALEIGDDELRDGCDGYEVEVSELPVRIELWSGDSLEGSLFLRQASPQGWGAETLGERLNEPNTNFLAVRTASHVELLQLGFVAVVEVGTPLPEVERREQVGAVAHKAVICLRSGARLDGEFFELLPPGRRRISDLLNAPGDRFLLFRSETVARYINREAIARLRL